MLAAFCKADVADAEGRAEFELRQTDLPSLEGLPPGSMLLKTVAASICGSDLVGRGGCGCAPDWRKPIDYLRTKQKWVGGSGHEALAEVTAVVAPCALALGERVLAMVPGYIRAVDSVRAVFEARTGVSATVLPKQGAFSQFFVSHACACLRVPTAPPKPGFDPLWFVAAQPLGTIVHACKKLGSVLGLTVVVVGQGQNGLLMTHMIANLGAKHVIGLDLLPDRLVCARRMHATHTVNVGADGVDPVEEVHRVTGGGMADIAIDMVGHQGGTIDLCARLTKTDGSVLLFGLPPAQDHDHMAIRFGDFVRNIRYVCTHSPGMESFELAIDLLQQGRINVEPIFTHRLPFEQFPAAFDMANNYRDGVIKTVLTYD